MAKRYYWMKIDEEFFRQIEIKGLRKLENGDSCVIAYQKMLAYSLRYNARIYFDNLVDTFEEEIALTIDEDVEVIKTTLSFLERVGLVDRINEEELIFNQICELTGEESDNMQRVRRRRAKKKEEAKNLTVTDNYESNDNITDKTICNASNVIDENLCNATCNADKVTEEHLCNVMCNTSNVTDENLCNVTCNTSNVTGENSCNKNVTLDIEKEKELDKELELETDIDTDTDKDPKGSVCGCVSENLKQITKTYDQSIEPLYLANRQWFIQVAQKIQTLRYYESKGMELLNKKTGS